MGLALPNGEASDEYGAGLGLVDVQDGAALATFRMDHRVLDSSSISGLGPALLASRHLTNWLGRGFGAHDWGGRGGPGVQRWITGQRGVR